MHIRPNFIINVYITTSSVPGCLYLQVNTKRCTINVDNLYYKYIAILELTVNPSELLYKYSNVFGS